MTVVDSPQRGIFLVEWDVFNVAAPSFSKNRHLTANFFLNAYVKQIPSIVENARLLVDFICTLYPARPVAGSLLFVGIKTGYRVNVVFEVDYWHLSYNIEILDGVQ